MQLKLLLIDDHPLLLKTLADVLEMEGHLAIAANGGAAGIDAFRAALAEGAPFAAVITDLGMPEVDGHQVALAIRQASPATPVILLTGDREQLSAEHPHIDKVLAKPPMLRELRAALATLCAGATGITPASP